LPLRAVRVSSVRQLLSPVRIKIEKYFAPAGFRQTIAAKLSRLE
jgi:hypothetical protein